MNLQFDEDIIQQYVSQSQCIRVQTEDWVAQNLFCPLCGEPRLIHCKANSPVEDFRCGQCDAVFELKAKESKKGKLGKKIVGGAYNTMIERITSKQNPHFLFMTYYDSSVNNLIMIPNHFFTPAIIEKRKPLSDSARRAGWVGCNINIEDVPQSGKIFIIKESKEIKKEEVIANYHHTEFMCETELDNRSWIMDVLGCIDKIQSTSFTLKQMYFFKDVLSQKHQGNKNIEAKIRQQLQFLRDKGIIEFTTRGNYKKVI